MPPSTHVQLQNAYSALSRAEEGLRTSMGEQSTVAARQVPVSILGDKNIVEEGIAVKITH